MYPEVITRHSDFVRSSYTIDKEAISLNEALFLYNTSDSESSLIRLEESDDGDTWTDVDFSTQLLADASGLVLNPLSASAILFVASKRYLRISLDETNPDGVRFSLVQFGVGQRTLVGS